MGNSFRFCYRADRKSKGAEINMMTLLAMLLWFVGGRFGGLSNDGFWILSAVCLLIATVESCKK